jgi:exopolysaccharide biosynthesis polyprenyl glycosylphosphotransferase
MEAASVVLAPDRPNARGRVRVLDRILAIDHARAVERASRTGAEQRRRETTRQRDSLFRRGLACADMVSVALSLSISAVVLGNDGLALASLGALPLIVVVAKAKGLYDRDEHLIRKDTLDEAPALFGVATVAALLLWLSGNLLIDGELGRRQVLGTWILLFASMTCARAIARHLAARLSVRERCLLVGDADAARELGEKFRISRVTNAELIGWMPMPPGLAGHPVNGNGNGLNGNGLNGNGHAANGNGNNGTSALEALAAVFDQRDVHRVVIAPWARDSDELLDMIRGIKARGLKVSVLPGVSRLAGSSVELDRLDGTTLLGMRRFEITQSSRLLKRGFDLLATVPALIVLSPLFAAIAAAIRLGSPGPILFRQQRVGRGGREFEMLKFRSMVNGADSRKEELRHLNESADGFFKIARDPRVTPLGRLMRRLSLDELPQLINVVRGEMSLVGPRPLIPDEDRRIEGWHRRRLDIAPGITGHWQALGSSRVPLAEMVKLDYQYVADWSLWSDVRILLRTVPLVTSRQNV